MHGVMQYPVQLILMYSILLYTSTVWHKYNTVWYKYNTVWYKYNTVWYKYSKIVTSAWTCQLNGVCYQTGTHVYTHIYIRTAMHSGEVVVNNVPYSCCESAWFTTNMADNYATIDTHIDYTVYEAHAHMQISCHN